MKIPVLLKRLIEMLGTFYFNNSFVDLFFQVTISKKKDLTISKIHSDELAVAVNFSYGKSLSVDI